MQTGPGAWECKKSKKKVKKELLYVPSEKALPSYTHMAIYTLYKENYVKYLISQNPDGVHMKSGFPRKNMSELHGNTAIEKCEKCHKEHLRDFYIEGDNKHRTGYLCEDEKCGGQLLDTIVNFGEVNFYKIIKKRICRKSNSTEHLKMQKNAIYLFLSDLVSGLRLHAIFP